MFVYANLCCVTATATRQQVASEVRAEMARQRMTVTSAAKLLGLDRTTVSKRLAGKGDWRVEELTRLAEELGVPVSRFLERES